MKGAQAVALAVFMGRGGVAKRDIMEEMHRFYPTFEEPLLGRNSFNETCQGTLPICLGIIERANSFEEAIRYAIAVGGDSDTIGAIVGAIAESIWGVPDEISRTALTYLPCDIRTVYDDFCKAVLGV